MSGLALGRELLRRGREFVVLEAQARPGGVVRSARVGGLLLENGPQRARLTRPFSVVVNELGLGDSLLLAPRDLDFFIYRDGELRRVPLNVSGLLASDVVSWRGKLRALFEPLTPGPRAEERVATFFSRKLGRELYEHVVGPLYGGLYGTHPRDMVVGLSLGGLLRDMGIGRSLLLSRLLRRGGSHPAPACSFADGMEAVPRAMARTMGSRVRLNCPVRAIEARRDGWSIILDDQSLPAEQVVLAVPAPVAAGLLVEIAPDAATRIATLHYNPLAVVHLRADTPLRGMGFQVSLAESLALKGVTFAHSLFGGLGARADRTGVYTAYLGDAASLCVSSTDDDTLGEMAAAEFQRCTGFDAEPLALARPAMPAWDTSWSALQGLRLPPGIHVTANWESRPGLAGRFARARALATSLGPDSRGAAP